MKKIYFDLLFIIISAVILTVLVTTGILEKYIGFILIPILIAYYLGQLAERKFRNKQNLKN